MIVCVDVDYTQVSDSSSSAVAAGVVLSSFDAATPAAEHVCRIPEVADYVPGRFFERELPCVLALLAKIEAAIDVVVVDGYAVLDAAGTLGLGGHLYEALDRQIPVIGVAKSRFRGNPPAEQVLRGDSKRPLWVTAIGVDLQAAAADIRRMHGPHRLPTMLKRVDRLCRDS